MKKILYSSIIALAGLFAVSCETINEKVIFNPDDVVAPTVGELAGGVLAKGGESIELTFGSSDFNLDVASGYELQASLTEDFAKIGKVAADIADGKAVITQKNLNTTLLNLGIAPETEALVYFRLASFLVNEKNAAVADSYVYSNVISAKFTPYNAIVAEKDAYEHVWVIGDYCGWSHETTQFLYNYKEDKTTFTGIVDFGEKAANGFKLTGIAGWDDSCNWGLDGGAAAPEAEAGSLTLISSGGSSDIKVYSKRFYHFEFNKASLTLKMNFGADKIGIIGLNGKWGDNDDIVMEYNPELVRFYADIETAEATAMKFRADSKWVSEWGVDENGALKEKGSDISVPAGKYRVYLDLNKNEYSIDENMFGKPEPDLSDDSAETDPEEGEVENVYSIVGTINNWGDPDAEGNVKPDKDMYKLTDGLYFIHSLELTASDEFKIRENHKWDVSYAGPEENAESANGDYGVYKPVLGTAFANGGKNIAVGVAGTYDVTFDLTAKTILVEETKARYALIGQVNGDNWGNDYIMTEKDGVWTSPAVDIAGEFKIRHNYTWEGENYGAPDGVTVAVGAPFTGVQGGGNIKVEKGKYTVTFNPTNKEILISAVAE